MASKEAEAVAAIAEQNLRKQEPIGGSLPALPLEQGFAAARTATRRIHELLEGLKALKPSGEEVESQARELQKQLLALRRAHRAMIRFAEASKQAEQAARKLTEAEFQAFQTRKYESSSAGDPRDPAIPKPRLPPKGMHHLWVGWVGVCILRNPLLLDGPNPFGGGSHLTPILDD